MTRVTVLWTQASGYLNACLKALKQHDIDLFVSLQAPSSASPFSKEQFSWLKQERLLWWKKGEIETDYLLRQIVAFQPEILLCSGWAVPAYLHAARAVGSRTIRVLGLDTPWLGTPRQWVGRLLGQIWLKPQFEKAFVPGERQFQMAIRLGFKPGEVIQGLLAPDTALFARSRPKTNRLTPKFLFVGRLSPEKGVTILAKAYQRYRSLSLQPWLLHIAGVGPLASQLELQPGVICHGFVQPEALPEMMYQAGCLVVPSLYEPWGVQLAEGVTAGLPIIATTACGSAVHLVQSYFNGFLIPPNDVSSLAEAMHRIETCPDLSRFSVNSSRLAQQFTPELWATRLLKSCLKGQN